MAQPLAASQGTPAPRGVKWLDIQTAAVRMGITAARIYQLARERWMASGHVKSMPLTAGGGAVLHVREDADPRLARVIFPDQMRVDLRTLTAWQRSELCRRESIYKGWLAARDAAPRGKSERQVTDDYLARLELDDGTRITRATLFNWDRAYRAAGLEGLIDGRWSAARADDPDDDPFVQEVKRLYLDPRRRSAQLCYDRAVDAAMEHGWPITKSDRTIRKLLARIPRQTVALKRGGEEEYNAKAGAFIERDYSGMESNEQWIGDHHRFDVMVSHKGKTIRPWLTAWMDARSRRIVGYAIYAHSPNSDMILASFRRGCEAHGVPKSIYIDNGKDYDARDLQGETKRQRQRRRGDKKIVDAGVFTQLDVAVRHARPYHPQSKPIERFFGTAAGRFSRQFDTYCGRSPDTRPHDLFENVARGQAPDLDQFIAAFDAWLEQDYHNRSHGGQGMDGRTPREVFDLCMKSKRTAPQGLLDTLLLKRTPPMKVGRNGVIWRKLSYGRHCAVLAGLLGQWVTLRIDDRDVSKVQVYSAQGDLFLCIAQVNEKLPAMADAQEVRAAIAEQRRDRKRAAEYFNDRRRTYEPLEERMYRARMRHAAPQRPGPSLVPIQSPLAEQVPAIERAKSRLKKAVGAELAPQRFLTLEEMMTRRMSEFEAELAEDQSDAASPSRFIYQRPDAEAEPEETASDFWIRRGRREAEESR